MVLQNTYPEIIQVGWQIAPSLSINYFCDGEKYFCMPKKKFLGVKKGHILGHLKVSCFSSYCHIPNFARLPFVDDVVDARSIFPSRSILGGFVKAKFVEGHCKHFLHRSFQPHLGKIVIRCGFVKKKIVKIDPRLET